MLMFVHLIDSYTKYYVHTYNEILEKTLLNKWTQLDLNVFFSLVAFHHVSEANGC